jgi:hypothetical protein
VVRSGWSLFLKRKESAVKPDSAWCQVATGASEAAGLRRSVVSLAWMGLILHSAT